MLSPFKLSLKSREAAFFLLRWVGFTKDDSSGFTWVAGWFRDYGGFKIG